MTLSKNQTMKHVQKVDMFRKSTMIAEIMRISHVVLKSVACIFSIITLPIYSRGAAH